MSEIEKARLRLSRAIDAAAGARLLLSVGDEGPGFTAAAALPV
ncbi:MAG TPA: hypothetical protein VFX28_17375 [Methylomirabilota bacterium]|nr:hypothetical protein [Methylomirabilota bacterium]